MKKVIHISGAPKPLAPYSQAILANDTLYISGQIPIDPFTGTLVVDNVTNATERILLNIQAILKEADMELSDVVKCTCFLDDMANYEEFNQMYGKFFTENAPARECVQVVKLPRNVPVEISCIAVK